MTVLLANENDDFLSDKIMQFVHLVNEMKKRCSAISQKIGEKIAVL
jgi:hypothetical protein